MSNINTPAVVQTERDEGVPGGGKAFPIDRQMLDSSETSECPPEYKRMLEDNLKRRAERDMRLRTFHRTKAQTLGKPGTYQGNPEDDENDG